jgi:hypothetical protein
MSLGKLIGRGNTAEVFELSNKEVLKLFYEKIPFEYIEKEYETSRVINQLGIPSPNVRELTELDNKWGIIYEKIIGRSFTQVLSSQPLSLKKMLTFSRIYKLHSTERERINCLLKKNTFPETSPEPTC